ncbi:glutamate mutase L [bacterium]|nr:glutamate mutase L [bacterium]
MAVRLPLLSGRGHGRAPGRTPGAAREHRLSHPASGRPGGRAITEIRSILATDCGSTTTKAILIEKRPEGYRLVVRGEAPTTVEAPFENVLVGVVNAVTEVEELCGRKLLRDGKLIRPQVGDEGVDLYVSTSSAGGGLQMLVAGVVKSMTAESAARAALGAGAIVMETIASNDKRPAYEQIERIRHLRPDMVLLSGGVDGGTITHVVELAEMLAAAAPRPRLGKGYDLPLVFAGNKDALQPVKEALDGKFRFTQVPNLRPVLERENLGPARQEIHELFMHHVMAQAPGYPNLMEWSDAPIMPTPGAVGLMIETIAREEGISVLGVDIGGATTDVFSVFSGKFNRTVSANLGMSYSISNVLASTGVANVMRWLPFTMSESDLRNRIKNKMIRPTTIPQTLEELKVEQAIAREALQLALEQHKEFATSLKGVQQERTISEAFDQSASGETLVDMMALSLLVGSGGVLSHAPRRSQAALMLLDAFEPEGVTQLAVDSIFMMPQLGVLSTISPQAAAEVFHRDCLIMLGTAIAPRGPARPGHTLARITLSGAINDDIELKMGDLRLLPLALDQKARATIVPQGKIDVGAGKGRAREVEVSGGVVGLILDGRGRPLQIPAEPAARVEALTRWAQALGVYPDAPHSKPPHLDAPHPNPLPKGEGVGDEVGGKA